MGKKSKTYTAQEKAKVALEALKGNLTYAQITSKYGVHSTQIHRWKSLLQSGIPDIFKGKARQKEADQDSLIEELYKQIGQQKVELDWIKKKSELFS